MRMKVRPMNEKLGQGESEMRRLFSAALTLCMLGGMAVGSLANTQTKTPYINHRTESSTGSHSTGG